MKKGSKLALFLGVVAAVAAIVADQFQLNRLFVK